MILKQHLTGTHYHWDEKSETMFSGEPSRRIFNRFNGNQVLFLINFVGALSDRFSVEEGRKIERAIWFDLPEEKRSEISVLYWIKEASLLFV